MSRLSALLPNMDNSLCIGKVFGVELRLHYSWFIIFALVTVALVYPNWARWPDWLIAIFTSVLFFTSLIAHELAHSLVGKANGIAIRSITLFIFGGIARMTKEVTSPGAELKMAVAGPLCSLAIGGLFYLIFRFAPIAEPMATMIGWLTGINLVLAAFNLIPGFPLDGGRVFRSLLWRITGSYARSSRIAVRVGRGIGYLFIIAGILMALLRPFHLDWFSGLWLAFIGWFLENAASASYRQVQWRAALSGVTAAQVMTLDMAVVPSDITVSQLVQDYALARGRHYFVVVEEGSLRGALSLHDIKSVPRRYWGMTRIAGIMTPVSRLKVAEPDQDALTVFEQMTENNTSDMPVICEGKPVGIITRENLLRFFRVRSELGI